MAKFNTPGVGEYAKDVDQKDATVDIEATASIEKGTVTRTEAKADLFKPLEGVAPYSEEHDILTLRALVVGIVLGSLILTSNTYLGRLQNCGHSLYYQR